MNEQERRDGSCLEECCEDTPLACASAVASGCACGALFGCLGSPLGVCIGGTAGYCSGLATAYIAQRCSRQNPHIQQNIVGNDIRHQQNYIGNSHASTSRETGRGDGEGLQYSDNNIIGNDAPWMIFDRSHMMDPNNPGRNYGLTDGKEVETEEIKNDIACTSKNNSERTKENQK
ncbi:MAG: hypothetical protein IJ590_04610 [Rickettsiales bacterium]|nr:hypothetical protein [Rickettsiales bacterium]